MVIKSTMMLQWARIVHGGTRTNSTHPVRDEVKVKMFDSYPQTAKTKGKVLRLFTV